MKDKKGKEEVANTAHHESAEIMLIPCVVPDLKYGKGKHYLAVVRHKITEETKMKKDEEKKYYAWLENLVRGKIGSTLKTKEERDVEIMMIAQQILKKYPNLMDRLIAGTIDTTSLSAQGEQDIVRFLGKSEKGTTVIWKDRNGTEYLFINAGEGSSINKKRVLILSDAQLHKDDFKSLLFTKLLTKDIEHIYNKAYEKNRRKQSKRVIPDLFSSKNSFINSAGSFEKNFKKMIQKQGYGASGMGTASVMIRTMSAGEKKKLNQAFAAMGIKNADDLQTILEKWRMEAMQPSLKSKLSHNRKYEIEMER